MDGYADFKSHVTRREEKGLFGIPFKRLLLAGCGGGMALVISRIPFPNLSLLVGLAATLLFLVLTAPRGGIPRWQVWWLDWRWRFGTASITAPDSLWGSLARLLQLPPESPDVDGSIVFSPDAETPERTDLADWMLFARWSAVDHGDGLFLLSSPDLSLES